MLVGPGRAAAGCMDDAEYRVRPQEIPGINRIATMGWIARQLGRVDGTDSAVGQARSRRAAVQQVLIDLDALFVLGGCAGKDPWLTRAVKQPVSGVGGRRSERTVVGEVIEGA